MIDLSVNKNTVENYKRVAGIMGPSLVVIHLARKYLNPTWVKYGAIGSAPLVGMAVVSGNRRLDELSAYKLRMNSTSMCVLCATMFYGVLFGIGGYGRRPSALASGVIGLAASIVTTDCWVFVRTAHGKTIELPQELKLRVRDARRGLWQLVQEPAVQAWIKTGVYETRS